jgi:arginase
MAKPPAKQGNVIDTPLQSFQRLTGVLSEEAAANPFWSEKPEMEKGFMSESKKVVMFGAPVSEGQGLSGVDKMAECMRHGGLQKVIQQEGWTLEDMGDLPLKEVIAQVQRSGEAAKHKEPKIHNCYEIGKALERIYDACYQAARRGAFVLCVGGDHSVASASIAGVMKVRKELCVVWVDAHGDCNTPESSPSGNYHGMPAAHVLGWFRRQVVGFDWMKQYVPEHRFCFIALRDIDPSEAQLMRNSGIKIFSMHDVDKYGIGNVMDMAMAAINPHNDRPIHLSFDIDGIDPLYAPGTGTKAKGGLTYREGRYICEYLARTNLLGSMDIVEVNTELDQPVTEHLHGDDPTIQTEFLTVQLAIELVASAIGKKLL